MRSATADDGELCLTLNIHTSRRLSSYRVYGERWHEHTISLTMIFACECQMQLLLGRVVILFG